MERPRGAQASGLSGHGAEGEHWLPPGLRSRTREGFGIPWRGMRPSPPPRSGTLFRFGPCAGWVPGAGCRAPASASVRAIAGAEIAYRDGSESSQRWVSAVWPGWPGAGERSP